MRAGTRDLMRQALEAAPQHVCAVRVRAGQKQESRCHRRCTLAARLATRLRDQPAFSLGVVGSLGAGEVFLTNQSERAQMRCSPPPEASSEQTRTRAPRKESSKISVPP
jgi:hypothetical protein